MEMGVFEALPLDGTPVTATVLAENLGVEKDLLGGLNNADLKLALGLPS